MSLAHDKEPGAGGVPAEEKRNADAGAGGLSSIVARRFRLRGHGTATGVDEERPARGAPARSGVGNIPGGGKQADEREGNDRQHHLRARVAELEAEVARLRAAPPDLSKFGETELAAMASEAAATILRAAMRAVEEASNKARDLIVAADSEVQTMRSSAHRDADLLRRSASEDSARIRQAAATEAEAIRKEAETKAAAKVREAERIRRSAAKEMARLHDEATAAAEAIHKDAASAAKTARRDAQSEAATKLKEAEDLRRDAAKEVTRLREQAVVAAEAIRKEAESKAAAALSKAHAEAGGPAPAGEGATRRSGS